MRVRFRVLPPLAQCVLILLACCAKDGRDFVVRLARVAVHKRPIEARISGGFRWAPVASPARGVAASSQEVELTATAAGVLRDAAKQSTREAHRGVAIANLVSRRPEEAITELAPLAASANDPTVWNDLAAARYTSAVTMNRPEELVCALTAVDAALRADGALPEALFNRALILERFGIREPAENAWKRYLEVDGASAWATEARGHLRAVAVTESNFREIFNKDYDRMVLHPNEARALTRRFPQESRTWGETAVLGRWADATKENDTVSARRHLDFAREIGKEIALSGDTILERAVTAIDHASTAQRTALADGHFDLRAAQRIFGNGKAGEAEPIFRRATRELQAGSSPIAFIAHYFAAYAAYEQGRMREASRELETLLETVPESLPTCRARIQWQLAICRLSEARFGEAIDFAQGSLAEFELVGEKGNAAIMREHIAQANDLIGDTTTAWSIRAVAMPVYGRFSNTFLQAGVLGFLSQQAAFRRDWAAAASFVDLELEVGRTARYDADLVDAYLRRALIRQHLGVGHPDADVAEARAILARIPDPGMRTRLEARRVAVEALVTTSSSIAIPMLSAAIDFHSGPGGQRMFLPTLWFHRARTHRTEGSIVAARADRDAAIAEMDRARDSLRSSEQRSGMFESADAIFDEAIDLALASNDTNGAFDYTEHARARTLLEAMTLATPRAKRLQTTPGTAVIEYAVLPSRIVAFIMASDRIQVFSRALNRDELSARATAFTDAVAHNRPEQRSMGLSLYGDLIKPLQESIVGEQTLAIIPDATLSMLPFAALIDENGRYLVETHALITSPSAGVFSCLADKRQRSGRGVKLLTVVSSAPQSSGLAALPDAEVEGRRVTALYGNARMLHGAEATRAAFSREAPRASVIHFAGHALSSEYSAADTAIVLADGRMNTDDIQRLTLRDCSLVVLSACSTARGKVQRFEGAASVARAFLSTGVPGVVATLWPIEDRDAALFFTHLHERLAREGLPPAEALRAAQLESIRSGEVAASWAGIQLNGS